MTQVRWSVVATALFLAGGACQLAGTPTAVFWVLYLACYVSGGWEPAVAGWQALREKSLDVDLLMIVAAIAAASIGQVFDGALLIVIFATSGALEAFVTARTEASIRALLDLAPQRATRLDVGGSEEVVDAGLLAVGDLVQVRPGEVISADGVVVDGRSDVDQASITGEAVPVLKEPGAKTYAGTLNGTGTLRIRVEAPAAQSVVARIVAQVEQASATKARTQLFIETIEQRYSFTVVAATLALFFIPFALGGSFQPTLLRAMTFMIVASPCALVLATMPPLLAAIANAGRHGVLIKSAVVMERLAGIDLVAFDKTGTLTEGAPRVIATTAVHHAWTQAQVLAIAAAAEGPSEHPLGRAVASAGADLPGPTAIPPTVTAFRATPGRGVTALVDGQRVEVDSTLRLAEIADAEGGEQRVSTARAAVQTAQRRGQSTGVVIVDDEVVGVIALADAVRSSGRRAVEDLTRVTGREPILLTGDHRAAADHLAGEVGLHDVRAGLLPADKVDHVRALQEQGHVVLVIGDGINDAPALAAADLGVAMGRQGSDLALQTADAVIVRDELSTVATALELARRARRVVKFNITFAASVILVLITWDLLGNLPLPLGVAGHEGSTVVVGLNGLRLLSHRAWRQTTRQG